MSELLACPECGAHFYYKEDLDAHYEAWHKPGSPYYLCCPKCSKRLASRAELEEHLRKHPEETASAFITLVEESEEESES